MGQGFFLSLYDEKTNEYMRLRPFFPKLGEIAYNEHHLWGYIKDNPLRVGFIGDQNERYAKEESLEEEDYDYGVASVNILYQSDCAGVIKFDSKLPKVSWTGFLVNHTKNMYVDVKNYYEKSFIKDNCIDPLVVLTASNQAATLFWDGFSENSAYSLLSYWFTDIIEWVDSKPENMNELCDLEFCEFYWQTMLDEWGITDDGYLANRTGDVFFLKKDLGLFESKILPAKIKFKISNSDTHTHCKSELVPDEGVVLVNEEEGEVSFADINGNKFTDFKHNWFGSAFIRTPGGEVISFN